MRLSRLRTMGVAFVAFVATPLVASTTVTLNREFIEANRDRATFTVGFVVDEAHDHAKPKKEDGDIHIAGWSDDIGLATVAEIMNARKEKDGVRRANELEGRVKKVTITGVWRVWPEHGGDHEFVQGEVASPATSTNPDHVFEVHPLTEFDGIEVADSIGKISTYKYKTAEDAFHRYENSRFHLECFDDTVRITMSMIGYNYTKFELELAEDVTHTMQDGGKSFFARIIDDENSVLVSKERMILVPGTAAFEKLKNAKAGQRFKVLGLPRLSLSLVNWRCAHADDKPWVLDWNIPYEMVILAVF